MAVKKAETQALKRKLGGLDEEQKTNKIKELVLKEELAYWRAHLLRKYRDEHSDGMRGTLTTF